MFNILVHMGLNDRSAGLESLLLDNERMVKVKF